MSKRLTTQEFIQRAQEIHQDEYDYSLVEYITNRTKVKIICSKHGEFEQGANNHLNGQNCPKCSKEQAKLKISNTLKSNTEEFIEKAQKIHNKYDYSLVNYASNSTNIKIICPEHGEFEQTPRAHLRAKGCQKCGKERTNYEKYKDKKTTLYYIFFPEYNLYKIGVTKFSVEKRFKGDIENGLKIKTIDTKEFLDGHEAFLLEQKILHEYREYKYFGEKILYTGNTELFTKDVLEKYK